MLRGPGRKVQSRATEVLVCRLLGGRLDRQTGEAPDSVLRHLQPVHLEHTGLACTPPPPPNRGVWRGVHTASADPDSEGKFRARLMLPLRCSSRGRRAAQAAGKQDEEEGAGSFHCKNQSFKLGKNFPDDLPEKTLGTSFSV